jgi:hypothetical protein
VREGRECGRVRERERECARERSEFARERSEFARERSEFARERRQMEAQAEECGIAAAGAPLSFAAA